MDNEVDEFAELIKDETDANWWIVWMNKGVKMVANSVSVETSDGKVDNNSIPLKLKRHH